MRYSIMLQIVVSTTLFLVGAGAFFGWLQTRPVEGESAARLSIASPLTEG
jgi:hypothetical protein